MILLWSLMTVTIRISDKEGEALRRTEAETFYCKSFSENPPILIFDEATSALDNESEKINAGLWKTITDRNLYQSLTEKFREFWC